MFYTIFTKCFTVFLSPDPHNIPVGWLISPFKVLHDPAPNTFITLFSNPPLCMHFIQSCLIKLVYFLFFNVDMESRGDYLSEPQFHHLENKKY